MLKPMYIFGNRRYMGLDGARRPDLHRSIVLDLPGEFLASKRKRTLRYKSITNCFL
jgi:hypothetical protein